MGTVWNNWQTQWSGVVSTTTETIDFHDEKGVVERTMKQHELI